MNPLNGMMSDVGIPSLFFIVMVLICIGVSWWALQSLRFELFIRNPGSGQAKVLHLLLSVILGYQVAKFIIDYFSWSVLLKWLF